jgi:hypothetical protein
MSIYANPTLRPDGIYEDSDYLNLADMAYCHCAESRTSGERVSSGPSAIPRSPRPTVEPHPLWACRSKCISLISFHEGFGCIWPDDDGKDLTIDRSQGRYERGIGTGATFGQTRGSDCRIAAKNSGQHSRLLEPCPGPRVKCFRILKYDYPRTPARQQAQNGSRVTSHNASVRADVGLDSSIYGDLMRV